MNDLRECRQVLGLARVRELAQEQVPELAQGPELAQELVLAQGQELAQELVLAQGRVLVLAQERVLGQLPFSVRWPLSRRWFLKWRQEWWVLHR